MSSLYTTFGTDKSLEKDGIVLEYGSNAQGVPVQIRIARAGGANVKFAKVLEHKLKPYKRTLDALDNKVAEKLLIETYADTVILSWTGVQDREGNDLEFNRDNVIKVLTDLPDLFIDIQQQSQKFALFREEIRELDSGNSASS